MLERYNVGFLSGEFRVCHKTKKLAQTTTVALLAIALISAFFRPAQANPYHITNPIYFPTPYSGVYIYFPSTVLPQNFSDWYYDGSKNYWNTTIWITTTTTITITGWFTNNWLNYTVTAGGTQQIHNGTKPGAVYVNGFQRSENDGWTYADGTVTITAATSSAWLKWTAASNDPPSLSQQGYTNTTAGSSCTFYSQWTDDSGLSAGVFGCNATGSWQNETEIELSGTQSWFNVTKTLPASPAGKTVQYKWWVKDDDEAWTASALYSLLTTSEGAPYYSVIGVNTTSRSMPALFYSFWHDADGISHIILCWNGTGGVWGNITLSTGGTADEWGNTTQTLPASGTVVGYCFYCNDTLNNWAPVTNIETFTVTEIWYYFDFIFKDLDANVVDSFVSADLYNGTTKLDYSEGQVSILNGTYTLKVHRYNHLINQTSLQTWVDGNSSLTFSLQWKAHSSVSGGFIIFNNTISSITVDFQTILNLTFTVSGSGAYMIIVDVPENASIITRNGVAVTGWSYSPLDYIIYNATSLSVYTLLFPGSSLWPISVVGPPEFRFLHVRVFVTNGSMPLAGVEVKVGFASDETWVKKIGLTDKDGVAAFDFIHGGRYFARVDMNAYVSKTEYFVLPADDYVIVNFGRPAAVFNLQFTAGFWLTILLMAGIVSAGLVVVFWPRRKKWSRGGFH
jgi:hypothetical protein